MQTRVASPLPPFPTSQPLLLRHAVQAYLQTLTPAVAALTGERLGALEEFLGESALLLAYTRPTGEAWVRSLPEPDRAAAQAELATFRAFLRDHGWLDAARPVNVLD